MLKELRMMRVNRGSENVYLAKTVSFSNEACRTSLAWGDNIYHHEAGQGETEGELGSYHSRMHCRRQGREAARSWLEDTGTHACADCDL